MEQAERRDSHAAAGCSSAPSQEAWQAEFARAKARLAELQLRAAGRPAPAVDVLRSSQVDAARLDTELTLMLGEQFSAVFKFFQAGSVARFEPELNGLLRLLIFSLSVWKGRATPGSELMNLRYRDERAASKPAGGGRTGVEGPGLSRAQRAVFGLGYVGLPYLWSRLHRHAVQHEWGERCGLLAGPRELLPRPPCASASTMRRRRRAHRAGALTAVGPAACSGRFREDDVWGGRAWSLMRWLESGYKVAALANLLLFFRQGRWAADGHTRQRLLPAPACRQGLSATLLHPARLLGGCSAARPAPAGCAKRRGSWRHRSYAGLGVVPTVAHTRAHARCRRPAARRPAQPRPCRPRYRNLLERLLGARLVYATPNMARAISFEYLNRQLVWRELSEFLLFLLPLVNISKVRRAITACFPKLPSLTAPSSAGAAQGAPLKEGAPGQGEGQGQGEGRGADPCPICSTEEMVAPHEALPCGHVFCYYCLRAHCEAERQFQCPLDGRKVVAMRRWCVRM
jgi:hypothetical protein